MNQIEFNQTLWDEFTDAQTARSLLRRYFSETGSRFTGSQFENLCDTSKPNTISEKDLLAVQALSVDIPIRAALWILGREGSGQISSLLEQVGPEIEMWDPKAAAALAPGGPLWKLWDLLEAAHWPAPQKANDLGLTKISKLIATKRPRLSPVLDRVITEKVFPNVSGYWEAFRTALSDEALRARIEAVTSIDEVPRNITLLRRIDVVLWSRHHDDS